MGRRLRQQPWCVSQPLFLISLMILIDPAVDGKHAQCQVRETSTVSFWNLKDSRVMMNLDALSRSVPIRGVPSPQLSACLPGR